MTLVELYNKISGNYADVQGRLMKDSLIEKFALMYLQDTSYDTLIEAISAGNLEGQFHAAHSLKGVCANLGFSELQVAASQLTEQLRPRTETADPVLVSAVKNAQERVVAGLQEYKAALA